LGLREGEVGVKLFVGTASVNVSRNWVGKDVASGDGLHGTQYMKCERSSLTSGQARVRSPALRVFVAFIRVGGIVEYPYVDCWSGVKNYT